MERVPLPRRATARTPERSGPWAANSADAVGPMTAYQLVERDDEYHIEPLHPQALTTKVFVQDGNAYIEPCGATPDGYSFPVVIVAHLLNHDAIVPHYYEREPDQMEELRHAGVGFDIVGEPDSIEELRNLSAVERLTEAS